MEILDSGSFETYQPPCQSNTRTATRVKYSEGQLSLECLPPEVPTIKNAKTNGDQPLSNGAVCKTAPLLGGGCKDNGDPVDNGEKINASEEKLKDMMMEMNQTLNMLTATDFSTSQGEEIDPVSVGEEMSDPALSKAISRMKRLDIKLADATKRERRVKRQRKKLEKLLDDGMEPSSALALVQSELNSDEESSAPSSPVFPTELRDTPVQTTVQPKEASDEPCVTTNLKSKGLNKKNLPRPTQDFIKRNIELVQDAGSLVAMTDEEKKRLGQLLEDGIVEDMEESKETNHYELALINETAFVPDNSNLERLREIDSRLEAIMPAENQRNISTPESSEAHYMEFKEALKAFHCEETIEESEQPGEIALMEFKHSRDEQQRLREIDQRLKYLEMCENQNLPPLSADQLKGLIDQCCREQSIVYPSNQSSPLPLDHDNMDNSQ